MSIHNKKYLLYPLLVSLFLLVFIIVLTLVSSQREKKVYITSEPPAASFKVGNIEGKTSATIKLKSGKYDIELSGEKYKTLKSSFSIAPLKKEIKLHYRLEALPPEITGTGGEIDISEEEYNKKLNDYRSAYPFADSLPVQTNDYYISKPSFDGTIHVYVLRAYAEEGKAGAYRWFSEHGVADPSKLNIIWKYNGW